MLRPPTLECYARFEARIKPTGKRQIPTVSICPFLQHARKSRQERNPFVPHRMVTDVNRKPDVAALPSEIGNVWFPFVQEGIIRTFSIEQNPAARENGPVFLPILGEVYRVYDRFRGMNCRFIPTEHHRCGVAMPKMNWNLQTFRNEAGVMSLILIEPINQRCEGPHFTVG